MSDALLDMFDSLEREGEPRSKDVVIRAPFGYPGGKSRSIQKIITHLPYTDRYVSVFGGSGIDILARHPVKLEVFNDRFSGVTAFYRCLRHPEKFRQLCDWIDTTIHSREDFVWCKETWEQQENDVERACRWYYMVSYSFASLGRNWGRTLGPKARLAGKLRDKVRYLPDIHERFRKVQVENASWQSIVKDYDNRETVFYMDPPYVDAHRGIYKHEMSHEEHAQLIDAIFHTRGFVAVSGYPNPLYDSQKWDRVESWTVLNTMESMVSTEGNNKKTHSSTRPKVIERLWIKESK